MMRAATNFAIRPAVAAELPALDALIGCPARALGVGFYTQAQTEAVSRHVFGIDSQLVADGKRVMVTAGFTWPAPCGLRRAA